MIESNEIVNRIFIWGVFAVAVVPRQASDRKRCSVGGDMTNGFRKLLLGIMVVNLARFMGSARNRTKEVHIIVDLLGIVEVVAVGLLCFLPTYILQTWLGAKLFQSF